MRLDDDIKFVIAEDDTHTHTLARSIPIYALRAFAFFSGLNSFLKPFVFVGFVKQTWPFIEQVSGERTMYI